MTQDDQTRGQAQSRERKVGVPLIIGAGVLLILGAGALMVRRVESETNTVALSAAPKPVSVRLVTAAQFRPMRVYVGTIQPWIEAKVGPQFVSAYVSSVRVRPGALVKRGDVLATLDCRNANATSEAASLQARALAAQEQALTREAERMQSLVQGGFVSTNEVERKLAESAARKAELLATRAKWLRTSLEVDDCVLRAPFDGEVATRSVDEGAFARPGSTIVSVLDRSRVRIGADVPEVDFNYVAPGAEVRVHVLATGQDLVAPIARRSPAADGGSRTVHFELDIEDKQRSIPVGTTAQLQIAVGTPVPASQIPLAAATVRGEKARVFYVNNGVARTRSVRVLGESQGQLFVEQALAPRSAVITEGRALLQDGDAVSVSPAPAPTELTGPTTALSDTHGG